MTTIHHRFQNHNINTNTETLIVGTFNPDTPENIADFFYGRSRNYLWTLLPASFQMPSLKGKEKTDKLEFISKSNVDFIDLIASVEVDKPDNYDDRYLDGRVSEWRNVISVMKKLPMLKQVCFTRKTLADIPKMKERIEGIKTYCEESNIRFQYLPTPARFYNDAKQTEWSNFFNHGNR
ncbi:MAG: hypothetical protein EOO43_02865 [Flavobacterium sp.]|nr:MAG: hypothetical protein EOO43_02865 [Flavobacterium sp.]